MVDASVLADALTDDGDIGDAARAALVKDEHWAAPDHLVIEVVSVIRGRHLGGKLSDQRASDALVALTQLFVDHVDVVPLINRIWELRANVNAYDAAYVAAAEALGCPLLTADTRLAKANGVRCEVIEV